MSKNALVTGASRGIGREIAISLAKAGYNVAINYLSNDQAAEETAEEIRKEGVKALLIKCDVSDFDAAKGAVDTVIQELGSIDVLVNNAGINRDTLIMRMKEQDFDDVISANLKSAFNCTRHAVAFMARARQGRIINISSVAGIMGNAGQANYSASKAGIIGLTKAVAREVARRGVTVNAVAPGFIETDMTKAIKPEILERALEAVPMGKMGRTSDIGAAVVFLAGENASYITGQTIVIDGGMSM